MAEFILNDIAIKGITCAVPENKVVTRDFSDKFGSDYVESFIETTGVETSYRTPEEQTASDLCFVAAEKLINEKQIDRESIGALVFISQTPDYRLPATACVLHKRLGLGKGCIAFDVNLGCSAFVYGLNIVGSMMNSMNIDRALLLNGDTCTKTNSPEDKSEYMLFGDAGTATLLEKSQGSVIKGELMTDGEGFKAIIMPSGGYRNRNGSHERTMWGDGNIRSDYDGYINGADVFVFSISQVPKLIKKFVADNNIEEYDGLFLHQANRMMFKQIAKKTKIPIEKIPVTIDRFGNTSGASIPLTLCDVYGDSDDSGNGDKVADENTNVKALMCGFGIGLSWGVVYAEIAKEDIYPIIYTNDYYSDGGVSHD